MSNLTRTWIENSIKTKFLGGPDPNSNQNSVTNVESQRELNRYATFLLPVRNEAVMHQSRRWSFSRLAQFFCSLGKSHRSTHKAQPFSLSIASLSSQSLSLQAPDLDDMQRFEKYTYNNYRNNQSWRVMVIFLLWLGWPSLHKIISWIKLGLFIKTVALEYTVWGFPWTRVNTNSWVSFLAKYTYSIRGTSSRHSIFNDHVW